MATEIEMVGHVWDGGFGKLVEELNRSLCYQFEANGWTPRRVEEITSIEVVNGELHVSFRDTEGGCWVQEFKGEGWRELLNFW